MVAEMCRLVVNQLSLVMELLPGCGENLVLFFLLLVGCVLAETHGYGSSDPTLARPGNSGGETAGSRVVESSQWDCAILDERMTSIGQVVYTLVLGKVHEWYVMAAGMHAPTGALNVYDVAVKQLSGQVTSAEISTDVAINVQL